MQGKEKISQYTKNSDTSGAKIEAIDVKNDTGDTENPLNFPNSGEEKCTFDDDTSSQAEKKAEIKQNSINNTINFTDEAKLSKIQKSDTSTNILDPLSEIDNQQSVENSSQSTLSEDENLVFSRLFPSVSLKKLRKDELFCLFSSHNGQNLSISDLYTNYLRLINAIEGDFAKKSLVSLQNKLVSPGSLASSEKTSEVFFTKEQVLKMSAEQISKNYDIIRKSQQKW